MGNRKYLYFDSVTHRIPNVNFWGRMFSYSAFPLCLYYEDGKYYEFFTGKELAPYYEYTGSHFIREDHETILNYEIYLTFKETPSAKIFIDNASNLDVAYAQAHPEYVLKSRELSNGISATEFAEKVRPLMKYKEQIIASIEVYLAQLSAQERNKQAQEKREQAKKEQEQNDAENWLDSVIKGNK